MSASYPPMSRKVTNVVMLTLTGLCTLLVLSILLTILGYLLWKGASSLNLAFFTKIPAPVGQPGGGVENAIIGTLKLLALATAIGVPIGLLGGIYLSEFAGGWSAFTIPLPAASLSVS
jgi:phosphate transport system permease protein